MEGKVITRIRRLSGLKMWELAKILGIQQSLLSKLERGQVPVTEELVAKIEKVHEDYQAKELRYGTGWSIIRSLVSEGYSYKAIGDACDVGKATVRNWERGAKEPDYVSQDILIDLPLMSRPPRRSH